MPNKEYKKLHAEWYVLISGGKDHTKEIDFWVEQIRDAGEPALELGSGTGRVLTPLLERGVDVVGVDDSLNMMAQCRIACEKCGVTPTLYEQSMLTLDLPQQFGFIFLDSGGLGLFHDEADIKAVFARVMAHLKPGGVFIYEFQRPPQPNSPGWDGDWLRGPGGVTIAWQQRYRPCTGEPGWESLFIIQKFVDGQLVETEANERKGCNRTVEDALGYAEAAGFVDARATKWLCEDPPDEEPGVIMIRCRKPGGAG